MNDFDKQFFPDDTGWFKSIFKDPNELFASLDRVSSVFHQYYQGKSKTKRISGEGIFLIKNAEVNFFKGSKNSEKQIEINFGSSTLLVKIPEKKSWSSAYKEELRSRELLACASIIKESQLRMMVFIWTLLSPKAQNDLKKRVKLSLSNRK